MKDNWRNLMLDIGVVIGNPPYNNGADIDFIDKGFELSKNFTVMITPAKWQTQDDNQRITSKMTYGQFRRKIVPYIREIVFFPCCKDIFNILQVDGITYFIVDKVKHSKCYIHTKSKWFNCLESSEFRSIQNRETLINIGNKIVEHLGEYNSFKFPEIHGDKKYTIYMNTQAPGGQLSTLESKRKTLFIGNAYIKETSKIYSKCFKNTTIPVFESNDINECNYFLSWIWSKFTQFFCFINQSKLTGILTNDCFRFVPEPTVLDIGGNRVPGKFDHTYTDDELYKTFNLPQKYIEIIEEIIKERKLNIQERRS